MSFATDIHNDPIVKRILLKYFPKPNGLHRHSKKVNFENPSPSLIGNAYEMFVRIHLHTKRNFKKEFEGEYLQARKNIERINKNNIRNLVVNGDKITFLTSNELIKCWAFIDSLDTKTTYIKEIFKSISVLIKTHQDFSSIDSKILFNFCIVEKIDILSRDSVLIDRNSLAKFYEKLLDDFTYQILKYKKDKKLTLKLLNIIILFANISSQWFQTSHPIKIFDSIKQSSTYLEYLIKNSINSINKYKGKKIFKPKLHTNHVLATPDFIIGNSILELKTSKTILSQNEYLQCLVYLIFSNTDENKRIYGTIQSVEIYYALHDFTFILFNSDIKHKLPALLALFKKREVEFKREQIKLLKRLKINSQTKT